MEKIDEIIQWHEAQADTFYDDMVIIELEKINKLYDRYTDHGDEMFVEEMIESFCKVIGRQSEKIEYQSNLLDSFSADRAAPPSSAHSFMRIGTLRDEFMTAGTLRDEFLTVKTVPAEPLSFQDDKALQDTFTQYCLGKGISSYTVNDYCSRLRKVWKSFEDDYRGGLLGDELAAEFPEAPWDAVLLNVYDCIAVLGKYIEKKIAESDSNRNWQNSRAALNKFGKFKKAINAEI